MKPILKIQFLFLCVLLTLLSMATQSGFGQAAPLTFGNNLFVTGDYIVAGAQNMNKTFSNGYAVGTITIPDPNPGITGIKQVPAGAQIVDAILYWQTVEKTAVAPGGPGSGQNGYFRPLGITGGPAAPGYSISGVNVSNHKSVSWSNGGCSGTSTGKLLQTYRTDVVGLLPQDANGNVLINGQFEVRLPSVSNNSTPLTLGATLVVIYRVVTNVSGKVAPLDAVVIYEGAYAPTPGNLNTLQTISGFYQPGNDQGGNVITRLTHIVSSGQSNKYQNVYLKGRVLPSLYGPSSPPFPGYYGMWDNPTWTLPLARTAQYPATPNPIASSDSSVTTEVDPTPSNAGCVSWGAIIVGTTVQDTDKDGILDIWKTNQGYTDVGTGLNVSLADEPLDPVKPADPPQKGHKDVFIQLDYTTEPDGTSFRPSTQVLQNVHDAFLAHNVHLHFSGFNEIPEGECTDTNGQPTCAYPNQTGVTTWRGGLEFVKNYLISNINADCTQSPTPPSCVPRFSPAQKDSYHYVVFGDSVGDATWSLSDGSLTQVAVSGTTATFTTSNSFPTTGLFTTDPICPSGGRVSIADAISNPNLNGTFCVQSFTTNTFTIKIPSSPTAKYTHANDPNIAVATGQALSRSGTSDLGGAVSLITLGLWGADGQTVPVQAGTLMHELGHTFYLPHGGVYYNAASPYLPIFEANCKPNYQSVMSYLFQVDLLDKYDPQNNQFTGGYLDFSEDTLKPLTIGTIGSVSQLLTTGNAAPTYGGISWYAPGTPVGTPATRYCDGTPLPANNPPQFVRVNGIASAISPKWANNQNINFGPTTTSTTVLDGFNDWTSLELRQVGATGSAYVLGGAFPRGGGAFPRGGGAFPRGGGDFPSGGGAYPRGGGAFPRGGGLSGGDINHQTANAVTRPARNLTATEDASARNITLNWSAPTFGQIGEYNIYRSSDGGQTFPLLTSVSGNPPATTYTDTTATCNTPKGYQYFVTAVLSGTSQESVPSNTASVTAKNNTMTGCYTNTPPAIALNDLSFGATNPAVQGTIVPITWTLQVDNTSDYVSSYVTNPAANSLYAVGPVSADGCNTVTTGRTALVLNGVSQSGASTFDQVGNTFRFQWNTDAFCAGSYTFELDTDSGQKETTTALTLNIDINDQNNPHITTVSLPGGTVGVAYTDTLTEDGGTKPFTWNVTGLPTGISQNPAGSAIFSGTACSANTYSVNASVTDAKSNTGTQAFTLQILKGSTTTGVMSSANPSVFQQPVTLTVTVASQPASGCTPTGTVTLYDGAVPIASNLALAGGTATFMTSALSVGVHSITASYAGDSNFTGSTSAVWAQTVNKASTALSISSLSPSTVFVGQSVTVSYTFGVVAPGADSPIAPTGNVTVAASDGSVCMGAPSLSGGMCTLSPAPTAAGNVTYTVSYPGDSNFVASGGNGNYNVYKLAFTAQPSNTGVGLTITPAVQVTAEDSSSAPLANFAGGIILAIGSGPGTLAGTLTQSAVNGVATFSDLSINQIANGYTLTAKPAGGVLGSAPPTSSTFNIDTFYIDASGNFGTLDLATGTVTQLGAATAPGSNGIDLMPSLQVYAYNASNQLWQMTPSPLAATQVGTGTTGSIPDQATTGSLTNGSYFGIDVVNGNLYSIDTSTAATTPAGNTGAGVAVPTGCNLETSLSGSATTLYYTVGYSGANCNTPMPDTLYVIDPTGNTQTSSVMVSVNSSHTNGFVGSASVGGTLYGFTASGQEYSIDPATGVATFVVNTNPLTPIIAAGSSQ